MPSTWRLICSSIYNTINKLYSDCLEEAKLLGSGSSIYSVILSQKIYIKLLSVGAYCCSTLPPKKGKSALTPTPTPRASPTPDTRVYPWHSKVRNADELPRLLLLLLLLLEEPRLLNYLKDKCATRTHLPPSTPCLPPPSAKGLCKDKVSADKSGRSVAYFKASTTPRRRRRQWLRLRQLDYVSSHSSQRGHKKEIN